MLTYVSRFLSGDLEPFWPHVTLLSLAVLSSIAVGGGIIFERPKYPPSIHRVAFWLVVGGIAVEAVCTIFLFVFDEGISDAQQSKIIALEMRIASRDLSPYQQKRITSKISSFVGQPYTLAVSGDPESVHFLPTVDAILKDAGWIKLPPPAGGLLLPDGTASIAVKSKVVVLVPADKQSELGPKAIEFVKALEDEDIAASAGFDPKVYNSNTIEITVGSKPQ
jgi:hypothetical protein